MLKPEPFFRIAGTKTKISLEIAVRVLRGYLHGNYPDLECLPPFRMVEPFCGSATVSIHSEPKQLKLCDLQPFVILALQQTKLAPEALYQAYDKYRKAYIDNPTREFFYSTRDNPPKTPHELAAWYIFVTQAAFNWLWRVNKKGKCNTTWSNQFALNRVKRACKRDKVHVLSSWLNRIDAEIQMQSFYVTIDECGPGDVIYCDPPYVGQFTSYTKESFGLREQKLLAKKLREACTRGAVVVVQSLADHEFASLFADWSRVLLYRVRRVFKRGRGISEKEIYDWEMTIISLPRHLSLLDEKKQEDVLLEEGILEEAEWNVTTQSWEVWQPHQESILEAENTEDLKTSQSKMQMGLF